MPANKTRSPAISPAPRNLESAVRREHRGVLQWPRSTGPAIFAGKAYVDQLWLFWLAPVSGAVVAGLVGGALFRKPE